MLDSYSMTEARKQFSAIIHGLKRVGRVEITYRGRRVAVLLSVEEFDRLSSSRPDFWSAYLAFRKKYDLPRLGIESDVFGDTRDPSTGSEREDRLWL